MVKNRLVVPQISNLQLQILDEAHLSKYSIHLGSNKMYQHLRQFFWWINMKREIGMYVIECDVYQQVKAVHLKHVAPLQPLPIPA